MPPALPLDGEMALVATGVCGPHCAQLLRETLEVVTNTIGDHQLSPPAVCLLLVGRHPAAVSYAQSSVAAANAAGVVLTVQELPETATNADVANQIALCNLDSKCHGVVLQMPLPLHLDAPGLLSSISDDKDVDCLKESSVRRCLLRTEPTVIPCIAGAVEEVLHSYDVLKSTSSSAHRSRHGHPPVRPHVLLLGVPPLLAFPLELCLEGAGCRVTTLKDSTDAAAARAALQQAEVLLIGARRPDVVAAQWVKNGCLILDLGVCSLSAPALGTGESGAYNEQRDVLCLSCVDGLAAMVAAIRMRNASHAALCQQGFLEQDCPHLPPAAPPQISATTTPWDTFVHVGRNLNPFGNFGGSPPQKKPADAPPSAGDDLINIS